MNIKYLCMCVSIIGGMISAEEINDDRAQVELNERVDSIMLNHLHNLESYKRRYLTRDEKNEIKQLMQQGALPDCFTLFTFAMQFREIADDAVFFERIQSCMDSSVEKQCVLGINCHLPEALAVAKKLYAHGTVFYDPESIQKWVQCNNLQSMPGREFCMRCNEMSDFMDEVRAEQASVNTTK